MKILFLWLDKDGEPLAERAEKARQLGKPRAAFEVADLAWEAAQRGPVCRTSREIPGWAKLAEIPYFLQLSQECPATFERLVQEAILRTYDEDQIIFLEGDPCVGIYVVEAGWVKSVKISPSGREQTVRVVGPGEVFNETGVLIDTSRNQVTVVVLEPARVWIIRRQVLLNLMDECPVLARTITQHMAERVHYLMGLIEDLSLRSVKARLSRYILEQPGDEKVARQPWATQSELAARLGTVADVIGRTLNHLEEEGLIQVDRRQIIVLDRRRLEILAELE